MSKPDPFEERKQRLVYLSQKNNGIIRELAKEGIGVNNGQIAEMRNESFIQHMLGSTEDSQERLDFEIKFQEQVEKALENTAREARKQKNMKRLHVPGRDNGMPRGKQ